MADTNKYVKKVLDNLEEEAKDHIQEALKTAEQKITVSTIQAHWREILIVFLIITFVFMWNRMNNAVAELKAKQSTFESLKKIDKIDETLKVVAEHQQDYPRLDGIVNQLDAARQQIKVLDAKITLMGKDKFRADASKLSIDQLSQEFFTLGYPNTVVKVGGAK